MPYELTARGALTPVGFDRNPLGEGGEVSVQKFAADRAGSAMLLVQNMWPPLFITTSDVASYIEDSPAIEFVARQRDEYTCPRYQWQDKRLGTANNPAVQEAPYVLEIANSYAILQGYQWNTIGGIGPLFAARWQTAPDR